MENKIAQQIGNMIISACENDSRKVTQNNYTLYDYIEDFEGTEQELNIALIKWAARIL